MAGKKKVDKNKNKPDWVAVKTEYITKNISYEKLAEKHGISLSTLNKRARRENWLEERSKYGQMVERKIYNRMSNEQARKYKNVEKALQMALKALTDSLEKGEFMKYLVKVDGQPHSTIELDQTNLDYMRELEEQIGRIESLMSRLYGILPAEKQREYEISLKQAEAALSEKNSDNGGVQVVINGDGASFSE